MLTYEEQVAIMSVGGDACAMVFYAWVLVVLWMMVWTEGVERVAKAICGVGLSMIGFCIERFGEKIGQTGAAMIDWDGLTGLHDPADVWSPEVVKLFEEIDADEKFNDDLNEQMSDHVTRTAEDDDLLDLLDDEGMLGGYYNPETGEIE